ncbi:MAG TPA: transporter [Nevskiaceae bacterium]|nr:transporter [Nevskiaceae bacterium]
MTRLQQLSTCLVILGGGLWLGDAAAAPFEVSSAHVGTRATFQTEAEAAHAPGVTEWAAPKFKLEAPIIPHHFEFKISDAYGWIDGTGEARARGWGDVELEAKWALARQDHSSVVDLAIEPKWYLPTRARALGASDERYKFPVMIAHRWGRLQLTGEVEYTHGLASTPDALDGGVLATWRLHPALVVGGEIYLTRSFAEDAELQPEANLGLKWQMAPRWQLDGLVGHQLRRPEESAKLVLEYAL